MTGLLITETQSVSHIGIWESPLWQQQWIIMQMDSLWGSQQPADEHSKQSVEIPALWFPRTKNRVCVTEPFSQLGQTAELLTNWLHFCVNIYIPQREMTMNMSRCCIPVFTYYTRWHERFRPQWRAQQEQYPCRVKDCNRRARCYTARPGEV